MDYKTGDIVTRNSYGNDMPFRIINIDNDICYLVGIDIRLCADSPISDLKPYVDKGISDEEKEFLNRANKEIELNRDDYFYLPGKILHIDGDEEYLNKCLSYYHAHNTWAYGIVMNESDLEYKIRELLEEHNPNILIITGHDAYYKKKGNKSDINAYKNSHNFINAVKKARKYENSHEKLIIIAGACQSDYEELIKAGANFASSPKRINIHALDPAIIATAISLSDASIDIDLKGILDRTKYGANGIGGIKTKGTMYIGYPR